MPISEAGYECIYDYSNCQKELLVDLGMNWKGFKSQIVNAQEGSQASTFS